MKALLALLILVILGTLIHYQNTNFHPVYSRETYLFKERLDNIIEEVNSGKGTWVAGHNEMFDNMGIDAIKGLMGVLDGPSPVQLPVIDITPADYIPDSFDPKEQWPKCQSLKEIRDQSNCGSCWAFGAVEAMTDRWCIHSNQEKQDRISAEDLTACCNSCGFGCQGGYPDAAWSFWVSQGLVTGNLYGDNSWCEPYTKKPCDHHSEGPYGPCPATGPTPQCTKKCNDKYSVEYKKDKHYGQNSYRVPSNVEKIQTELMTKGPIEVAFTVYEDFLTYKSGVYQHKTGGYLGGHAVKMVGWGVEDGVPYWLIANSWNEHWGYNGYFKILRGKNHCGIEGSGVAGIPKY